MNRHLDELWSAMESAVGETPSAQTPSREPTRSQKSCVTGLSPWAIWLLVGLARHRERQLWVAEVIQTRLDGSPRSLAVAGAFGHPENRPQSGVVPGLTEWEYFFHGCGCCLTQRMTGESIDVDFFDDDGEFFDIHFYLNYLTSLKVPAAPERRLIELHPSISTITLVIDELLDAGALEPLQNQRAFRLSREVVNQARLVDAFCRVWSDPTRRLALALAIGDWFAACDSATDGVDDPSGALMWEQADACRQRREAWLLRRLDASESDREALMALAELRSHQLDDAVRKALSGQPGGRMLRALQLIAQREDPAWRRPVFALFNRLDPKASVPEPAAWRACASFLLRQGYKSRVVLKRLCQATRHELAEAALLVLEHDPPRSRPLFRAALRSSIPDNRLTAAAALAILDERWSRSELMQILLESSDQEMTCECRAALCCSSAQAARDAVATWERQFPYQPEPGPLYSMKDVGLRQGDQFLQSKMTELHDRVLRLRGRL